jgi:hypothetical protein
LWENPVVREKGGVGADACRRRQASFSAIPLDAEVVPNTQLIEQQQHEQRTLQG